MSYENTKKYNKKINKLSKSSTNNLQNGSGFSGSTPEFLDLKLRTDMVEQIDTTTINANCAGFRGICFDGRYIYMAQYFDSSGQCYFLRYDTTQAFVAANVDSFNLASIAATTIRFTACTFDGRYVYMSQFYDGTGQAGRVVRYDTTASFIAAGSYSIIDLTTIDSGIVGIQGMCFDGRYVYGNCYLGAASARIGWQWRYDTTQSFATGNVDTLDLTTINSNYKGFGGLVNTDKYIYYLPLYDGTNTFGNLGRHEIGSTFDSSGFEFFDLMTIDSDWGGFQAGTYDGRYLYLFCNNNADLSRSGRIVKYDTTKPFDEENAYEEIDKIDVSTDYATTLGGVFDGRFIYPTPFTNNAGGYNGYLTKIDTFNFIENVADVINIEGIYGSSARACWGACFDGKYIYLAPYYDGSGANENFIRIRVSINNRLRRY